MNAPARKRYWFAVLSSLAAVGCSESTTPTTLNETPAAVLKPAAPDETPAPSPAKPEPAKEDAAQPATSAPPSEAAPAPPDAPKAEAAAAAPGAVSLESVTFEGMIARIAANKGAKFTMVDAWATWCGPCKENFPHVVEMSSKYGAQGLAVASLSFDDPTDAKALAEAKKFLTTQHAAFNNFVLSDGPAVAFDKLAILSIPAVFLYGPDGKELKRFTGDDPNNQFTYEQVEQTVAAMLKGEPIPAGVKPAQ